ncbi:MAG: electron transport complex subunit RsxC [Deltaproteobacteria bacterium]|nr:electron transport complex subunit RsxC [Deltaproteobacteria bacterium]
MNLKTFERGIHPSYHKGLTSENRIEKAELPKQVIIPLRQHLGAPSDVIVKKGDLVQEGQMIGEAGGYVSAPVHASINGKVKDVVLHTHPGGGKSLAVIIDGDGTEKDWGLVTPSLSILDKFTGEELKGAIGEAGIVGMGGAAFPTYVKLSPPKERKIDTVILNGCECEPYLTADHRLMVEQASKVIIGLEAIKRSIGASKIFIGIEDNKKDAVSTLNQAAKSLSIEVEIVILETKYPQGAEKMLIKAVTGQVVPVGKLPLEVGVLVNNVGTTVAIYDALALGKPLIERVVTISGNGIKTPRNLLLRVGTSFAEVIEQCGGVISPEALSDTDTPPELEILNGGPMMGVAQSTIQVPVIKGTSGITLLTGKEIKPKKYSPCIKCSSCVTVCPMGLIPLKIADMGRLGMIDDLKSWDAMACIECGCCSFVCPSKRPLVQWIRVGKVKLRELG